MAVYSHSVSQSIFKFIGVVNSKFTTSTFSYNESSSLYEISEDYGLITSDIIDDQEDYGSVAEYVVENESYGFIYEETTITFGTLIFDSRCSVNYTARDSINGLQFALQGGSLESFGEPYIGYENISILNQKEESYTPATEIGSGVLFGFNGAAERTSFSFNESSVASFYYEDFGFISDSSPQISSYSNTQISELANKVISTFGFTTNITQDDYGNILPDIVYLTDNYGVIFVFSQDNPYGLFNFVGDAAKTTRFRLRHIGSGSLFGFTGSAESTGVNPPISGLFNIGGSATESTTPATEIGSGSLFNFITKEERRTYSYNTSSQVIVEDEDFGFINEIHITQDDYGTIIEFVNRPDSEDYGLLTTIQRRPFGLLRFEGDNAKITRFRLRHIGSGSLFGFTGSAESTGFVPDIDYGLFSINGSLIEKNTESYVGSGTLFNFISATESTGVVPPVSGLFSISGTVIEKNTEDYVGSGTLFNFISATESTGVNPPISGLFGINGSLIEKNTESYVGSGSLFNFITKEERRTYSYNTSSQVIVEDEDFGFISDSSPQISSYSNIQISELASEIVSTFGFTTNITQDDYGTIIEFVNRPDSEDYGLLTTIQRRPFGLFSINGSLIEKNTESYVGSGTLFNFISATESTGVVPDIDYGLFSINGSLIEKNTESYVGSGTLFNFITKEERRTYSYNGSSVTGRSEYIIDYGFINEIHFNEDDYGFIRDESIIGYRKDDYGFISIDLEETKIPFGRFILTGSLKESIIPATEIGSGTLFNFISATESTGVNPPVSGLFSINGSLIEKNTESYVGSGSLFGFTGSAESTGVNPPISGLFSINGSLIEKNTESYVGSGTLFGFTGSAESITPATEVGSILFSINGSLIEKNTESYVGSGSLFNFITKEERRTYSYNTSSQVIVEDEDFGFINEIHITQDDYGIISELVNRPDSEDYGLLTIIQRRPFGRFKFSGRLLEKYIPDYIGSGSLFGFTGSAESITPATEVGSILFSINGSLIEKNTESYVGSGTLFNFISATESTGVVPPVSGLFSISGTVIEKNTEDYVGSGSLFGFTGSAESITPATEVGSILFSINGSATESTTPATEIGSGTLFNFITKEERRTYSYNTSSQVIVEDEDFGFINEIPITSSPQISAYSNTQISELASEIVSTFGIFGREDDYGIISELVNRPDSEDYGLITAIQRRPFGLFSFNGTSIEKNTESYLASGSLFGFTGSAESTGVVPPVSGLFSISGNATESTTPATEIGSGTLFNIITKEESRTYSYNGSSILYGLELLDYGFISSQPNLLDEDYGDILLPDTPGSFDDYLYISQVSIDKRPYGTFRFSGNATNVKNTESYVGSGSLFNFISATESTGVNPPTSGLIKFRSNTTISQSPAPHVGTGLISPNRKSALLDPESKILLVSATESTAFSPDIPASGFRIFAPPVRIYFEYGEKGSGRLTLAGDAIVKTNPRHFGSGRFTINGIGFESITPTTEIGSGSLFSFVSGEEKTTPATHVGSGKLFTVRGEASDIQSSKSEVGNGLLRVNVETDLIVIWDYPVNLKVSINGTLSESITNPEVSFGKISINGESKNYFSNKFFTAGSFRIFVDGEENSTKTHSGSGSLFSLESSTESVGSNPPDKVLPIKLSGNATETKSDSYFGYGSISSREKRVLRYKKYVSPTISEYANTPISDISDEIISKFVRYGYLESDYSLVSADERFVSSPPSKDKAFEFKGTLDSELFSIKHEGSGKLFGFGSSAESSLYDTVDTTLLFDINGSLEERRTFRYSEDTQNLFGKDTNLPKPFGQQFVFGSAIVISTSSEKSKDKAIEINGGIENEIYSPSNVSEGSLFGFGSSAESATYSSVDKTTIFIFEGNAEESISIRTIGSGSLFGFVSHGISSLVKPKLEVPLFKLTGKLSERFIPASHIGSGSIFSFVGSSENTTVSEKGSLLFRFNIDSKERNTVIFKGSGTISSLTGSSLSFAFDYPLTQKILKIFGSNLESFGKSNYKGSCQAEFIGSSINESIDYIPPKPIRLYII